MVSTSSRLRGSTAAPGRTTAAEQTADGKTDRAALPVAFERHSTETNFGVVHCPRAVWVRL